MDVFYQIFTTWGLGPENYHSFDLLSSLVFVDLTPSESGPHHYFHIRNDRSKVI